jgi:hypothetical protein
LALGLVIGAIVTGLIKTSIKTLDPAQREMELTRLRAVLPFKIGVGITWHVVQALSLSAVFVLGSFGIYYVMRVCLNWLDLRSRLIQQKDGVFPVVKLEDGVLYDPNRAMGEHPLVTMQALEVQRQAALRADKLSVNLKSLPGAAQAALEQETGVKLPDLVKLADVCHDPSLNRLTIGVDGDNTLTESLYNLMHVLAVGASGFGKSAFLRMLIWQFARCREALDVVAIDINGSEFNAIRNWERLLYPVARETGEAVAVLDAVGQEIERRKRLYEPYPQAFDLPSYNRLADEQLNPLVVLCDEGTNLLNQSGIGDPLREVTQTARQYGVFLLLAGQSATHKVIPTQVRDNFSSRLCFHTSPTSRRVVLGQSVDDVKAKGRAWAQINGRHLTQIQTPYVTREELINVIEQGKPSNAMPTVARDTGEAELIHDLVSEGMSDTAIAKQVYGYANGRTIETVKQVRRHDTHA